MEKLDININNKPPTVALISKARKDLEIYKQEALNKKKRKDDKFFYFCIFALDLIALLALIFWSNIAAFSFAIFAILSIFMWRNSVSLREPKGEDEKRISEKLKYINANDDPDICINYEKLIKKHQELYQYQKKVAIMGRKPIIAEYDAFSSWDNGTKERKRKKSAEVAIENIASYQ